MLNGLDLAGIKKLHAEYAEHAYKSDADPDWADMAHEHRGELLLEVERLRAEVADAREVQMIAVRQRDRANDSFVWFGGLDDKERVEKDENHRLRAALDSVVKHWREFGPEHGFDETLERAALAGGAEAKPDANMEARIDAGLAELRRKIDAGDIEWPRATEPASEPLAMDRDAQIRCFRDLEFGPLDVALAQAMEAARQAAMHRGLADTAGKLQWLNGIAACEKVELSNRWKEVRPSDQPDDGPSCSCGNPNAPGMYHRKGRACFARPSDQTEARR